MARIAGGIEFFTSGKTVTGLITLSGTNLPDMIRAQASIHLSRIKRAQDLHALRMAVERAEGFIEGVEASGILATSTVEHLSLIFQNAGAARRLELEA